MWWSMDYDSAMSDFQFHLLPVLLLFLVPLDYYQSRERRLLCPEARGLRAPWALGNATAMWT